MRVRTTIALALLVVLSGCSGADEPSGGPASPASGSASPEPTETPETTETASPSPTDASPTGGVAEAAPAPLDWQDAGFVAGTGYVTNGTDWVHSAGDGSSVDVSVDGTTTRIRAGSGRTISEVLMSTDWAAVVRQDKAETKPSLVVAIDLATGEQRDVTSPAAASGGSWALTGGDLYFPTYGDDRAYCLATAALADSNGEDGWCAPRRSGFSGLTASDQGVGVMTFDDARPVACRTANVLDDSGVPQPIEGPADCLAWDVAATAGGALWSEVPRPRRQEEARFHATVADATYDLGPGTTGTALPCGDSVFFVRDPQSPDEPARLLRWTPEATLEVAYESASVGNAFLGEPACGGGVITVASFGDQGDELVWAPVT